MGNVPITYRQAVSDLGRAPTTVGSAGRLTDFCITQLKAQGPSRTCNESKEEEEEVGGDDGELRPWYYINV